MQDLEQLADPDGDRGGSGGDLPLRLRPLQDGVELTDHRPNLSAIGVVFTTGSHTPYSTMSRLVLVLF